MVKLDVQKEESVYSKSTDAKMSVIEKHFNGETTQDISAALDTFTDDIILTGW